MAIDYGTDIQAIDDLDPAFSLVGGTRMVAQALARRFGTPRGGLFYDGEYGFDLRMFANGSFSEAIRFQVQNGMEAEAVKDERVRSARAAVTYDAVNERLTTTLEAVSDLGPFRLVLAVTSVTVEVLQAP